MFKKKKDKCFYCEVELNPESSFIINMNTSEGTIKTKICPDCAKDFDKIMIELESIIEERI